MDRSTAEHAHTDALAVTGAFLAVAFADTKFAPSEERRFLAGIANRPELSALSAVELQSAYNDLVQDFQRDYTGAFARVLNCIRARRGHAPLVAAIKLAAAGAIVADGKATPQEEAALSDIALALGVAPGSV